MKILIDIDENVYTRLFDAGANTRRDMRDACSAIRNGTPLPKGHGRLIDADAPLIGLRKMKLVDEKDKQSVRFAILEFENAPTIIEAEMAESEDK